MKPEQQRIAIAEACGWKDIQTCTCSIEWKGNIPGGGDFKHLPDYLNDLNAMHEAEIHLVSNYNHIMNYPSELFRVVTGLEHENSMKYFPRVLRATASQRAEAFLKAINKWED